MNTANDGTGSEETEAGNQSEKRERSRIGFPYQPLGEAIEVAKAIHDNVGAGQCSDDQLAPWLELSDKSSSYRNRISASKIFGLTESASGGARQLTELGRRIVDPDQKSAAKADAFLRVPLFNAVFREYRGNSLPPPAALENEFIRLGVAKKQTAKARSSFERSAKTAGYLKDGSDRLVKPGFSETEAVTEEQSPEHEEPPVPENGGDRGTRHPFIEGLLATLPEKQNGQWEIEERVAWLKAAAMGFDLIYGFKGSITIESQSGTPTKTAEHSS